MRFLSDVFSDGQRISREGEGNKIFIFVFDVMTHEYFEMATIAWHFSGGTATIHIVTGKVKQRIDD